MSTGGFIHDLQREKRRGGCSEATEHSIRILFGKIGWQASPERLAAVVDKEIAQLERELLALRTLREKHFG